MPLTFLVQAREEKKLTQALAAEQACLSQSALSNLEHGLLYNTKGEMKASVTTSIHNLAMLYQRPDIEEYFCSGICPIGKSRRQLEYKDFHEIWSKLETSLDLLEYNSGKIARIMEDGKISDQEWKDWPHLIENLSEISRLAKSADLWSRVIRGEVKEANIPKDLEANTYQKDRAAFSDQRTAAEKTGISTGRLSSFEQKKGREVPTPDEAVSMSRAYLSPRIRNFYCYHDCEIGGTLKPLDVHNEYQVSLMLVSSLLYVKDLKEQFRMALDVHGKDRPDPNSIQQYLDRLNDLSRRVDTIILWTQQSVCERLLKILADYQVSDTERPEYIQLLGYLEQLGTNEDQLEELRSYLKK